MMAFDQAIADEVCERIAKGETLRAICREEGKPGKSKVYNWLDPKHKDYSAEFAGRFACAREKGEDAIAQECLEIADNATNDWMELHSEESANAGYKLNGEHVQRSKLRIETRLKLLAKWNPKKYGDKLAIGGADDLPPIKTMPDEALAARIKALQDKVNGESS
jgi:hypothetical protein